MTVTIATVEPTEIIAGDYLTWSKSLSDYPATTFTLAYKMVGTSAVYAIPTTASGTDHLVAVVGDSVAGPPAVVGTDVWVAGTYTLTAYVTEISNSRRTTLESRTVTVVADPTAATAADQRSWAAKALAEIETILQDPAKIAQKKVQIDWKIIEWRDVKELLALYSFYKAEVARETQQENMDNGVKSGGRFFMRL